MSATKRTARPKRTKASRKPRTAARARAAAAVSSALLDRLVEEATVARERAYAPYSRYKVGAALATRKGTIFVGCNVENASLGATICAERGAIMQMVAAGELDPVACAVVTGDGASPCGICRQVLAEFARDMPVAVVAADAPGGAAGRVVQLEDLLPLAFELTR
jgi:cytidine deaminase